MKKISAITAILSVVALTIASDAVSQPKPAGVKGDKTEEASVEQGDQLRAQDAELLGYAQELSKKVTAIMEGWIAKNEVTEDRLFSYLYFPVANTAPPKFSTAYDKLADRDLMELQESYLGKSESITFVVTVDINGYLPTHNRKYSQPLTGNGAVDLVNNRTKRIFNDATGIAAARSTKPYLIQTYKRDTGELIGDLSVPVMIKGKHWGAVRFGYRIMDSK